MMDTRKELDWPTLGNDEWKGHGGLVYDEKDGFRVIGCEACGFKHIVPIPSPEELETVYKHEYYSKEKPLYLQRHREDLDWWNISYDERYDVLEQLLPPDRRRLLEIGSGPGFFLLRGKERGWDVQGIEPSRQAAEHSRSLGLPILEEPLSRGNMGKLDRYDAIHASEVLEHIPDPADLLEIAFQLLNPGGMLCVSIPNDYSPLQYALRKSGGYSPWWVAPPHHINYFDFDSLGSLLEKVGFQVTKRGASFPMELFLLMGQDYVGNDALGRECHGRRKAFEQALVHSGLHAFKERLGNAYAECSIGRTAILYAVRP